MSIQTDKPWQLWRTYRGINTLSGSFQHKRDAERAIVQLQKLYPDSPFKITYAGANISHCAEGGRSL